MTRLLKHNFPHILTSLMMLAWVLLLLGSAGTAFAQAAPTPQPPSGGAGFWSTIGNGIGNFILYIGSYIFGFFGLLLDASINKFIIRINELIGSGTSLGRAIDSIWVLVRDICNLAFIFGFIYVGIMTIIDAGRADTKRFLASIIIGALLINFSLFIAKTIIDVSNFISFEIYRNLVDTTNNGSIALNFADILGVRSIYTMPNADEFVSMTFGGNVAYYFMATLMLIVAGFVLATGAILLMIRFVALVFILCFSPVLFAATVFPATAGLAKDLWKKLLSYAFFAPVYLLLLIVSINVLRGVMGTMRRVPISNALANQGAQNTVPPVDSFNVILLFGVGIFFLIMSLQIAQKFGVAGANTAMGMVGSAKSWGQKKLTNTALFAPRMAGKAVQAGTRKVVGGASKRALKTFDKWQAKDKDKQSAVGKVVRGALAVTDIDRDIRGTLEAGKKAKFGLKYSYQDNKDYEDERKKRVAGTATLEGLRAVIADSAQKLNSGATLTDDEKIKLERALADASVKNLEEIKQEDRKAVVGYMSQSQIDGLDKSDKLSDADKSELGQERAKTIAKIYENNKELLAKANSDSLAALGQEYFTKPGNEENALRLTSSQLDDLKKKFTPTEFANVSKARENALKVLAEDGTMSSKEKGASVTLTQDFILKQKAGEIAKMPADVLTQSELAVMLPVGALAKIAQDGTLNREDQVKIREAIQEANRSVLSGLFRTDPAHVQQLEKAVEWLDKNPIGSQFGR